MAKKTVVKITGTEQAKKSALAFINNFKNSDEILNAIGDLTAKQIAARTRSAGRVDDEYGQEPLTEYTVKQRERLIRAGNSFDQTIVKKNRSNLSMSGQLLNSIYYTVNKSISEITMRIKKARAPYKGLRKEKLQLDKDNLEIKNDLESIGRKFFFISDKLTILLENRITQELRRKLSLYNKINRK